MIAGSGKEGSTGQEIGIHFFARTFAIIMMEGASQKESRDGVSGVLDKSS
jgi:hypothetical protein